MTSVPLKALLATLAVAGYQNRDKIADVLRVKQGRQPQDGDAPDATDKENGRLSGVFGEQGGFGELLKGLRLAAS